ncbi:META domain-containing protein [Mycetocola spongiae]|uniref:META domain-containing protein n=1 Tax=Mycetocola spongiae TaxID=2859226 RepID=UPI001CF59D9E|nr:META domain-containing protein [Mycetocola spongiae]
MGTWVTGESYPTLSAPPYLTIEDGGDWTSSDGCNTVTGTWDLGKTGDLTVTAGPSTLIACEGAPLPLFMSTAARAELREGKLVLIDAEKKELVTLETGTAPSTDPAAGGSEVLDVAGTWSAEAPAAGAAPTLILEAGGRLGGSDGCNSLIGDWNIQGDTLTFGAIGSTRMACEGVDTWLSAAATGTVDGDTLTVLDAAGNEIGHLTRR